MKNGIIITLGILVLYLGIKSYKGKSGTTEPVVNDAYKQALDAARAAAEKLPMPDHIRSRLLGIINSYDNPDSKKYLVEKSLRSSKDLMQVIIDQATGELKKLTGTVNGPAGPSGGNPPGGSPGPIPDTGSSVGMG